MHDVHSKDERALVSGDIGRVCGRCHDVITATAQNCMPKATSISSKLPPSTCMLRMIDTHNVCKSMQTRQTPICIMTSATCRQICTSVGVFYKPNLRRGVVSGVRMPGVAMELRCLSLASCSFCTSSAAVAAFRSATACICLFMTALCSFSFCRCSMREV